MFQRINVTGFSAFQGVDLNPTELIVDELSKLSIPVLGVERKLEVTVKAVDEYIDEMASKPMGENERVLNLHFGVGPNQVYFLETCGYNNKNFRIPDNNGYQCKN